MMRNTDKIDAGGFTKMGLFNFENDAYLSSNIEGKKLKLIKKEKWSDFNSFILGMGDISENSIEKNVICAFFDLESFTRLCNQIDPDLVIPVFLKKYLDWFFDQIQNETKEKEYNEGIDTWHDLPFFIKFLGDGLLVLWDISKTSQIVQGNIILSCRNIVNSYSKSFYEKIKKIVVEPPKKLRCGITKGKVYSVGNGNDFVGQCINFASRLQKLPGITFAFSNRGIDLEIYFDEEVRKNYLIKMIEARGIGENELVVILKKEFEEMNELDKEKYRDI